MHYIIDNYLGLETAIAYTDLMGDKDAGKLTAQEKQDSKEPEIGTTSGGSEYIGNKQWQDTEFGMENMVTEKKQLPLKTAMTFTKNILN